MGEGTLGNSTRERLQPRSPHMTFYRDVQTALDEDEELESASMRDTQTSAGAGGVYPGSQSSSRPDTPSTTHSQEMASNTRPRRGTNRLQAREDRSGVVPSRWNITSDAEVDSEDLGAWDSSQTSERTSSPGHSNRRRRSTGLLHASPLLWQSDARVWARSTDSIKLPTAVAEPLGSTPEKKPTLGKKRLLAKRESAQLLSNSNSALSSGINEKDLTSLNNSFSYGANGPRSSTWLWRRAQISLSSSGLLIITTTDVCFIRVKCMIDS